MVANGLRVELAESEAHMVGTCVGRELCVLEGMRLPLAGTVALPLPEGTGEALGLPLGLPPPPPPPTSVPLPLGVVLACREAVWETLGLPEEAREVLGDLLELGQAEAAGEALRLGEAEGERMPERVLWGVPRGVPVAAAGVGEGGAERVPRGGEGVALVLGEAVWEGVSEGVRRVEGLVLGDHVGVAGAVKLALGVPERVEEGVWLPLGLAE